MNIKKLVSAVSALAMAGSVFAGLAVTASAADIQESDVVLGIYDPETKTVSPQTEFETDNGTLESPITLLDVTYLEGSVLNGNQANGRTYNFAAPVTAGEVKFAANYTSFNANAESFKDQWLIKGTLSDGTECDVVKGTRGIDSGNWPQITLITVGDTVVTGQQYIGRTNNCFVLRDLTINLDTKKVSYEFFMHDNGKSGVINSTKVVQGEINLPEDLVSVTGLSLPRLGGAYDHCYDNMMFYHVPGDAVAVNTTIKKVGTDGTDLGSETLHGYAGDPYEYIISKYILNDGVYYEYQGTMPATGQYIDGEVELKYAPKNNIVGFYEAEDGEISSNRNNTPVQYDSSMSGGKRANTAGNTTGGSDYIRYVMLTVNVPETAYYQLDMAHKGDVTRDDRQWSMLLDATIDGVKTYEPDGTVIGSGNVQRGSAAFFTAENALLTAGEHTITIYQNVAGQLPSMDYLVITKTGEYVAPELPKDENPVQVGADYKEDLSDLVTGASLWKATLDATELFYDTINVTVQADDGVGTATETLGGTVVTNSAVVVYIAVPRISTAIQSILVEAVNSAAGN